MSRIPVTSREEVTPALQRIKELRLRVAILHSGGPAPGANRVLAGAAKQFLDRGIPVLGFFNGYEYIQELPPQQLIPDKHYILIDRDIISLCIDSNNFFLRTSRANPGKDIHSPQDLFDPAKTERLAHILEVFERLKIGALISIGGDDTLKTANFLYQLAENRVKDNPSLVFQGEVIHVPKTIDNDYYGIPWTFGFFTAAEAAGRAVRGLYDDAKATNCYHVVELMGRKAGWYTAAASIFARGTKAILPEDFEGEEQVDLHRLAGELLRIVQLREERGKGYGVFCIAEGLADRLPEQEKKRMEEDRHGNPRMAEAKIGAHIAKNLELLYREKTGRKKSFKPQLVGYETRQNPPSLYDVLLTSQLGVGAFRLIEHGRKGEMVTVRDNLEIDGIQFGTLVDQETLLVRNRNIDVNGDFYVLTRSLEEALSEKQFK